MKKPRILLADDHPVILNALCGLLEEDGVVEVVGMVTDGQALVEAAQRLKPNIIIADISMPKLNGLDATRALQTTVPQSKVIILSMHADVELAREALRLGASGYVLKHSAVETLSRAIY